MKILYHYRIGSKDGQYVHLEELTRAFARLGHQVILVGPGAVEKQKFGAEAGMVATLKKRLPKFVYELLEFGYAFPAFLRLWKAARRHHPDGIYERCNLFFPAGIWVTRILRIPFLLEVNAPLFEERSRYDGIQLTRLAKWSERYVWRGADFVLPVTQVLADYLKRAGVPDSSIVVIPNGVDPGKFLAHLDRQKAKQDLGLAGKLVLGFTGFIRDWHGLDRVIDWLASHQKFAPLHLLITGDGPARATLERRARDLGVTDAVTITGVVKREEVSRYIAAYDVALQPAAVEYASPLKIFEYLALGCAVIAPSMPNIREILVDGQNAVLFDPDVPESLGRAIERVCGDAVFRECISQGARRTIEDRQFTWDHNARRIVQLFEQLIAGQPVPSVGAEIENPIHDQRTL